MAKLTRAYGDALFQSAIEGEGADRLYEDVNELKTIFKDNPKLMSILTHPDISEEEKEGVLERVFGSWIAPETYGFLKLLIRKERIGHLSEILDYVTDCYKEYKHIGVAYVTSAAELSESQKKAIEKKLLATTDYATLEMHTSTDETLIGGVIIRIGDRVVDGSVKTRLSRLTRRLKDIQIS